MKDILKLINMKFVSISLLSISLIGLLQIREMPILLVKQIVGAHAFVIFLIAILNIDKNK